MAEHTEAKGSIQVIERMMSLLDALADAPGAAPLKTLSLTTGLHPSTAHRILAVMTNARLVERHDAGTYALGIRLLELGNIVKARLNIREVALPFMQQLHETIGEAINLGIRDGDEIVMQLPLKASLVYREVARRIAPRRRDCHFPTTATPQPALLTAPLTQGNL